MTTLQQSRRRHIASAINQVLSPAQRTSALELCAADNGRACGPLDLLSWMRVNMPVAADRVETMVDPQPFRD